MNIPDKSVWPQNADGTTDWEALFENQKTGLIAIVSRTETPAQLKQQSDAIIRLIFSRKRDQSIIDKVMPVIDKLIPDGATNDRLGAMQDNVIKMLRKAKDSRIKRAAVFSEKKSKQGKPKKKNNRRPGRIVGFFRRSLDSLALLSALAVKAVGAGKTKKSAPIDEGPEEVIEQNKRDDDDDEDVYFQQDAYVDDSGGPTEWQDNDLHAMKENESEPVFKDDE